MILWYNICVEGVGNFLFSPQKAVILLDKFPPSTRAKTSRIAAFCVIVEGKMKLIPLSKGKFAKVDDEDYEWLNKFKWAYQSTRGEPGYAARNLGNKKVIMHRVIINVPDGMVTDHINGDTLDNQKSNLRVCTVAENNMNCKPRRNNVSGYKGVCFRENNRRFQAQIKVFGKPIYLGCFDTAIDAARAYNAAAIKYHGLFARLNPLPTPPEDGAR